jgi:hypothetical protein
MSFASDIKAVTADATAQVIDGRSRVQGIYFVSTDGEGTIELRSGGVTGELVVSLVTPGDDSSDNVILPDAGLLFKDGVHATLTDVASVTLFYYGGAPTPAPPEE